MSLTEETFVAAYQQYWKPLFYFTIKITQDEDISKELVQDLFKQLWERHESIELHSSLEKYLWSAIRYKISEYFRKEAHASKKRKLCPIDNDGHYSIDADFEEKETRSLLGAAIQQLPPRCREVFTLSRENGLSNKKIAIQLGITVKAVEGNMTRALAALKVKLKPLI